MTLEGYLIWITYFYYYTKWRVHKIVKGGDTR